MVSKYIKSQVLKELENEINELLSDGYKLISVYPVVRSGLQGLTKTVTHYAWLVKED